MFKRSFVALTCLLMVCLLGMGMIVDAQAQCSSPNSLSMTSGSASASANTGSTRCYRMTGVSANATSFTLDVSVTSGSVNVYWASGSVSSLSRRLNAQQNLTTSKRFVPPKGSTSTYSLAIVPNGQSRFSFTLAALEPVSSSFPPICTIVNGQEICTEALPSITEMPILESDVGATVTFPFDAVCRSRLEATMTWVGTASLLELRLEDEGPTLVAVQGSSPLKIVYDSQPADFEDGNQWQWTLVNVSGGSVQTLEIVLGYPDDVACQVDPAAIYGSNACIYGYVWREAFTDDVVCVTGDVRDQTLYDNSQAASRIDSASPYGPDGCIYGYVWREASPTDHVCVTPDVRAQAAFDNSQAAARRDNLDSTSISVACPNSLPQRLSVGGTGRVTPGDPNRLREQPTTSSTRIGTILAGETFRIIDGPACADNLTWWKVQYKGLEGWTAESGNGVYWLEPVGS